MDKSFKNQTQCGFNLYFFDYVYIFSYVDQPIFFSCFMKWFFCVFCLFFFRIVSFLLWYGGNSKFNSDPLVVVYCRCTGILSEFVTCLLLWWQESLILMSCQYFSLWLVTFVSFKRNHSPKVINAFTHIASQVLKLFLSHLSL